MSSGYHFYLQKYPSGGSSFAQVNIETEYNCVYKQFKDFAFDGSIKNIYTETYTDHDGDRIYIPVQSDLAHESYECKLQLLFNRATAKEDARIFYEDFAGQKAEYYDSFRQRYVTLLMTKQPTISQEKLYTETPYQVVEFTFTNVLGRSFSTSQISIE